MRDNYRMPTRATQIKTNKTNSRH